MAVNEQLLLEVLEQIRPNLQADGGDMAYVGVDDEGVVSLELQGKEHVPGVTRVEAVNNGPAADMYDEYAPF